MFELKPWILANGRKIARQGDGFRKSSTNPTGSAEIKTGDRRVIECLLSPVMRAVREVGKER